MKTTIEFMGTKKTLITDFISLGKFIREDTKVLHAIITQELYERFNVIDYIDVFQVSEDTSFCSGHGSSESIPTILVPEVSKWRSGDQVWYEIHLRRNASRKTLEQLINTTKEITEENY